MTYRLARRPFVPVPGTGYAFTILVHEDWEPLDFVAVDSILADFATSLGRHGAAPLLDTTSSQSRYAYADLIPTNSAGVDYITFVDASKVIYALRKEVEQRHLDKTFDFTVYRQKYGDEVAHGAIDAAESAHEQTGEPMNTLGETQLMRRNTPTPAANSPDTVLLTQNVSDSINSSNLM